MSETFGFRLKQFALAVDIVDDEIFRQMWNVIVEYATLSLRPKYWALLTESLVNMEPGLMARECSLAAKPAFNLQGTDGEPKGLAAYSFVRGKPLWIVSSDRQPLGPHIPLRDEWSHATDLPDFDRSANEGIRTVMLVPLSWKGRRLGVFDLQSESYHELTTRVTRELQNLADTLAVLLPLYEANSERREHTLEAISLHVRALRDEPWPPLTKPQIFVACSDRADPAIVGVIRDVLNQYGDRLRVHFWRESSASGNINTNMLKELRASQFGLCYFSELSKDADSEHTYQDNPNVVFEAGMLQALTNSVTSEPTGWIPIRETMSPPAPFDFAQDRMILVQRLEPEDRPNLDALRDDLTRRLDHMLV